MDGALADYGLALELCFLVNAVFSLWGGLYRSIVKRQQALADGVAIVDSILASERYETIAVGKLNKTLRNGIWLRQFFWYAARSVGGTVAVCIYIGSIHILDDPLACNSYLAWAAPHWHLVELACAYLSSSLVGAMAAISVVYETKAKIQLKPLKAVVAEREAPTYMYEGFLDLLDP